MPSQIKVDEIKNVAGQYKIKTNVFEGQTTAGSITVQGEGTATTNLQQGLTKAWIDYKGTDTNTVMDSFNYSSPTDNGTGDYTMAFISPPSSANYSIVDGTERLENNNSFNHMGFETTNSTSFIQNHWNSGLSVDDPFRTFNQVNGDLA